MSLINNIPEEKITDLSSKVIGIYGRAGLGKTTLASQFDGVYFAETESGLSHLENINKTTITSYGIFLELCKEFCEGKHDFKTMCIDNFDELCKICTEWKCKELGIEDIASYKKFGAYHLVTQELSRVIRKLSLSKFGLILTSHYVEDEMTSKTKSWKRATISVPGKNKSIMLDICDPLLFMDSEMKGEEEIGIIRTKPSIYWEAKDKAKLLPESIEYPLSQTAVAYEKIMECYK